MADQTGIPFDSDYARGFFTKAGQGTRNLVDYFLDMSHGQADLGDSEIFGWLDVPHTADDLAAYQQQVKDDETKLEPALPFGGVTSDGGGLIWTPGRGWVRVPPRSPLYVILAQLAEIEQLQTLTAAPAQQTAINAMTTQRLAMVREDVSRIIADRHAPKVPGHSLARRQEGADFRDQ